MDWTAIFNEKRRQLGLSPTTARISDLHEGHRAVCGCYVTSVTKDSAVIEHNKDCRIPSMAGKQTWMALEGYSNISVSVWGFEPLAASALLYPDNGLFPHEVEPCQS